MDISQIFSINSFVELSPDWEPLFFSIQGEEGGLKNTGDEKSKGRDGGTWQNLCMKMELLFSVPPC